MNTDDFSAIVEMRDGRPRLILNGQEKVPVLYALSDIEAWRSWKPETQKNIKLFADQGIRMVMVDSELRHCWKQNGTPSIDALVADVAGVLEVEPNAAVIIRLHVNAPYWWMKEHPEEIVEFADGPWIDDQKTENVRLIANDLPRVMRVSLASEAWLLESGDVLRDVLRQLAQTNEGNRVIGFQIAGGIQGEWHQWGATRHEPDYSKPMLRRFRQYLRDTYKSDSNLQSAWKKKNCTIEKAEIPGLDERYKTDGGNFRHPVKRRNVIDSLIVLQKTITESILHFCTVVKTSWPRPVLCGAFNGYMFNLFGRAPISGQLEVEPLFNSPSFDFFCAPYPYGRNRSIDGYGMTRGLLESSRLHGKLCLMEMDQHPPGTPSYSDEKPPDAPVVPPEYVGGNPEYYPETIALIRRDMLENYTRGAGAYYYDHRLVPDGSLTRKTGWWENPVLQEAIREIQALWEQYGTRAFTPEADVAVIFDNNSYYSLSPDFLQEKSIENNLLSALAHSGAAFDLIHSFDLERAEWERYRCIIFYHAVTLTPQQRKLIRKKVRNEHRTVVWIYAPGYSNGIETGKGLCEDICGFSLEACAFENQVAFSNFESTIISYPEKLSVSPMFSPVDGKMIAHFVKSGLPAAARKLGSGGTRYFLSLPPDANPSVMRALLRDAGAHIYTESGDALQAGGGILAISSRTGGEREITLRCGEKVYYKAHPKTTIVIDAQDGTILLGNPKDLSKKSTPIFQCE